MKQTTIVNPGDTVHRLVMAKKREDHTLSYKAAMDQVLGDPNNRALLIAFAREGQVRR